MSERTTPEDAGSPKKEWTSFKMKEKIEKEGKTKTIERVNKTRGREAPVTAEETVNTEKLRKAETKNKTKMSN